MSFDGTTADISSFNTKVDEAEVAEEKADAERFKVFGFEHVISGISDIYWIESICAVLEPIIAPIETTLDQSQIHKISLLSSPIFFADTFEFMQSVARESVLFSHLFPQQRRSKKKRAWPFFMANGQIDVFHHVGITSHTFPKAVSAFSKFIQQRIYWLSVTSKKSHAFRFFFEALIVGADTTYTFDEIKRSRKKFETNIKHAVAQKHAIRMVFYFVAPDDTLLLKGEIAWHFYFRDVKVAKETAKREAEKAARSQQYDYSLGALEKELEDAKARKPDWTSFSVHSHSSAYHGFFVSFADIGVFADFFKHLKTKIDEDTFGALFGEWQVTEWRQIIAWLDKMEYGKCIAMLNKLANLVDATTFDRTSRTFASEAEQESALQTIQVFRAKVLKEMRLTLYGQGTMFQGFMHCVARVVAVLSIVARDNKEQQAIKAAQQRATTRDAASNAPPTLRKMTSLAQNDDVDHRLAGEWLHQSLLAILRRFEDIANVHYPLYSEYLHSIPRVRWLLSACVEYIPAWTDLSVLTFDEHLDEHLAEIRDVFDLIGDTLIRDVLCCCESTRQWIKQRRDGLQAPPPDLQYTPSTNVMKVADAIANNLKAHRLPRTIPAQGTFLQFAIDTEMDRWSVKAIFNALSDPQVFNPFIKIVVEAQQMSFKFDSYKRADTEIADKIMNLEQIQLVGDAESTSEFAVDSSVDLDGIEHLYTYKGLYGYHSALCFVEPTALNNIHKDIRLQIPTDLEEEKAPRDDKHIFMSFCGGVSHFPFFDVALDEVEVIQNVFISGSNFDDVVEEFATHCLTLAQHLFKKAPSVTFISLSMGGTKCHCDLIMKKSHYQHALKLLITAAKSRQSISMELLVVSSILKKYLAVRLDLFLIYHETTTNRFRLCWPFRADLIFSTVFFDLGDAVKFWRAYSVGDIASVYNLEHKDYTADLLRELSLYEARSEWDAYFHSALRLKALRGEVDGVVEIYRFFEECTLCGKCIESLQQLMLTEKILKYRQSGRFIKNQMNRQIVSRQMKHAVNYSKGIIFSDLLTFFDRTMLTYLRKYYSLSNAVDDAIYPALLEIIKVLIPVKHACTKAWASWLAKRNSHVLIGQEQL